MKLNRYTGFGGSPHIYRQIAATIAASMLSVSAGINFGFSAVLLPQLKNDASFPYDKSLDSWIAAIAPFAMIFGCLFSGTMSDGIGRKMGQIILSFPFIAGWIIMGLSSNNTMILVGRFITGLCSGSIRPNSMVYISELSDPKYRAIALFCPSLAIHIGCLMSHIIGKYMYWKTSCFIFTLPNFVSLMSLMFLKESPLWLLSKGKIDEGIESFNSFRGDGENSRKELVTVLEKCKVKTEKSSFSDKLDIIFSIPFMKSLANVFLLFVAVQWCGIKSLSFYTQEIFERTFSSNIDPFLLMLTTDGIRVIAAIVICSIAKTLPRKKTFVSCCFNTSAILLAIILYLCLNPSGLEWLAVTCMVGYIAVASVLACISWSFVSEIFPAKVRGLGSGMSSGICYGLLFIVVKVTPDLMNNWGEAAMYTVFAVITAVSGVCLAFTLPETNGKSLQDIEDEMYKNNVKNKSDAVNVLPNQKV